MSSRWTHRICERCWFDGPGQSDVVAYRLPVQVINAEAGVCCFCDGLTVTGIYVRRDPAEMMICGGEHDASDEL